MTAEQLLLSGENKINSDLNDQPDVYTEIMLAIGDALGAPSVNWYKPMH